MFLEALLTFIQLGSVVNLKKGYLFYILWILRDKIWRSFLTWAAAYSPYLLCCNVIFYTVHTRTIHCSAVKEVAGSEMKFFIPNGNFQCQFKKKKKKEKKRKYLCELHFLIHRFTEISKKKPITKRIRHEPMLYDCQRWCATVEMVYTNEM